MNKKILLLIISIFLVTGCTAEYNLTYEDGIFSENVVIEEEKVDGSEFNSITSVEDNPSLLAIDDDNSYNYQLTTKGNMNILTLDFSYKDISLEKSLIYNNCFTYKYFIEGDDYYYIKLDGDITCEYLTNVDITFETDRVVYDNNADEVDSENGIYKWNDYTGGELYFQVSKTEKISSTKEKNKELIPWYIKIIISIIVVGIIYFVYRKVKDLD